MSDLDLVFSAGPLANPAHLVFGDDGGEAGGNATLHGAIRVRRPALVARVAVGVPVSGSARVRRPVLVAAAVYNTNTSRPTVHEHTGRWQAGTAAQAPVVDAWQRAERIRAITAAAHQDAARLHAAVAVDHQAALALHGRVAARHQDGQRLHDHLLGVYEDAIRLRNTTSGRFQQGDATHARLTGRYEDTLRDRRNTTGGRWQDASRLQRRHGDTIRTGEAVRVPLGGRFQQGMKPPIGTWIKPGPPVPDPCYLPDPHLVFSAAWDGSPHLLFICDRHDPEPPDPGETIVVPVRRVYMTINSATLVRVDTGAPIPARNLAMSLDVDSWTWSLNASVPGSALPLLEPSSYGDPVEVTTTINGSSFRFVVRTLARERTFGQSNISVTGRGRAAELDSPFAPILSFRNEFGRTAAQLCDDVLTLNGVPIGWGVTFEPTDWSVPAGVFSHQGTYISALNTIAAAAGAYIQPHPTDRHLYVKLRYPAPSWAWGDVTPDFELPSAVTTREGIEWVDKPTYNRVYVVGQQNGVLGRYTRAGTAGDLVAPGVVDPLTTGNAAVRQRGRAIVSDGGRQAMVSLRLPVLAETGIIQPGKFVRYVDGGTTRLGLTRSVSVEVALPTIYQTLQVESHEPV